MQIFTEGRDEWQALMQASYVSTQKEFFLKLSVAQKNKYYIFQKKILTMSSKYCSGRFFKDEMSLIFKIETLPLKTLILQQKNTKLRKSSLSNTPPMTKSKIIPDWGPKHDPENIIPNRSQRAVKALRKPFEISHCGKEKSFKLSARLAQNTTISRFFFMNVLLLYCSFPFLGNASTWVVLDGGGCVGFVCVWVGFVQSYMFVCVCKNLWRASNSGKMVLCSHYLQVASSVMSYKKERKKSPLRTYPLSATSLHFLYQTEKVLERERESESEWEGKQ